MLNLMLTALMSISCVTFLLVLLFVLFFFFRIIIIIIIIIIGRCQEQVK